MEKNRNIAIDNQYSKVQIQNQLNLINKQIENKQIQDSMERIPLEADQRPMSLYIQPIHLHPWLDDIDSNPKFKHISNI